VKHGLVLSEIKGICDTLHPHAVVMGSKGAGTVERFIFGSVTLSSIKNLSFPLIIVPPEGKFEGIKKIGFPCDLKKVAKTYPIDPITELIQEFQAELFAIHVNQKTEERYNHERMLESEKLQNTLQDLCPSYHFLNNTDIDEGLTKFAERNDLDLLIVVPKKHNIISSIFDKSHSKQLALHSRVPIVAFRQSFNTDAVIKGIENLNEAGKNNLCSDQSYLIH
jgi:nucleotide-binding universal stress UspA family protein